MGIPSYYKNIIQDYPEIIEPYEKCDIYVDHLFFDLNCAIHPCCANKTNENDMYDSIFEKIKECIALTKVSQLVYIAIDGPRHVQKWNNNDKEGFVPYKRRKFGIQIKSHLEHHS